MSEHSNDSSPSKIAEAVAVPHRRWRLSMVWLVPIVAVLLGTWILVHSMLQRGPAITITFSNANGIEAGKTQIRYKDVVVGKVTAVTLAKDHPHVIVSAQMEREAERLLKDDTKFWVVTARVSAGSVTGLSTLLSGAYLGVDPGKSRKLRKNFTGQENAPIVPAGVPGRYYVLHAQTLGSLNINSPVYFRQINVGEVTGFNMDKDGRGVTLNIFVNEPYCRFVATDTRFWNASGLDLSLSASGVSLQMPSVVSLLIGGIAFDLPPDAMIETPAPQGTAFTLFADRQQAMKSPDLTSVAFLLIFNEPVRGLAVGAPVELLGIPIGEIVSVNLDFNPATKRFQIPVEIRLYPGRMTWRQRMEMRGIKPPDPRTVVNDLVARGMRAQLRSGSLITGQLYVACDFFPDAPKASVDWSRQPVVLPTVPGTAQQLEQTVTRLAARLDKLPLDQIGNELRKALANLDKMLASTDKLVRRIDTEMAPEMRKALADLDKMLASTDKLVQRIDTEVTPEVRTSLLEARRSLNAESPLQLDARDALREVSQAARALRVFLDYLERNPQALLRGKGGSVPATPEAKPPDTEKELKK